MTSLPADHFEALYRDSPDPWGFLESDYEREKYDRSVAAVAGRRYARGLELGCSIGVLTARLAPLCDALVACDAAPSAVASARERLAAQAHVVLTCGVIPGDLPDGPFDLVVASEVLYYLDEQDLHRSLDGIEERLVDGGTLLAVHWTPRTRTHPLQADDVHRAIGDRPGLQVTHAERHPTYRLERFERRAP